MDVVSHPDHVHTVSAVCARARIVRRRTYAGYTGGGERWVDIRGGSLAEIGERELRNGGGAGDSGVDCGAIATTKAVGIRA